MNELHDMVGAYVLNALNEEEEEAFRAHLAGCPTCQAEVEQLSRVVDVLPLAIDRVEPPAGLRDRILREVSPGTPTGGLTVMESLAPARRARRHGPAPWQGFTAAAAAVVLAAAGAWSIGRQSGNNTSPRGTVAMAAVAKALAHGGQVRYVQGAAVPSGVGAAVVQPRRGPAIFIVDGMKRAPAGKVYELWLIRDRQPPRSAGVFTASTSGPQVMRLPIRSTGWPTAAITLEPGPKGSAQPTTKPLLAGRLVA